jgi:hypothetical protein
MTKVNARFYQLSKTKLGLLVEVQASRNAAVPMSYAAAFVSDVDDLAPLPSWFNYLAF